MLRFHWLWSALSGPVSSKPTFLRRILPVQRRPWYDEKGNRRDKGAIGVKKGLQKRVYPTLFDVEEVNFCFKMLRIDFKNYASCRCGEHIFVKMVNKYGLKVENAP